jgi:hypothetical protein
MQIHTSDGIRTVLYFTVYLMNITVRDLNVDGMMILKQMFEQYVVEM